MAAIFVRGRAARATRERAGRRLSDHARAGLGGGAAAGGALQLVDSTSLHYFGADAGAGEYLEQDRMTQTPIDDVSLGHAGAERIDAAFDFGHHPFAYYAAIDEFAGAVDVEGGNQRAVMVFDAFDIGHEN